MFAAYLPQAKISHILNEELRANRARGDKEAPSSASQAMTLIKDIRKHGLGRIMNDMMPGVSALAAPVFNHRGDVVVALAAMGATNDFDARWNGKPAEALRQIAARVSFQLGYSAERLSRSPAGLLE